MPQGSSAQERLLRSIRSGRKNLIYTTGQGEQDSRVQRVRDPTPVTATASETDFWPELALELSLRPVRRMHFSLTQLQNCTFTMYKRFYVVVWPWDALSWIYSEPNLNGLKQQEHLLSQITKRPEVKCLWVWIISWLNNVIGYPDSSRLSTQWVSLSLANSLPGFQHHNLEAMAEEIISWISLGKGETSL